MDADSEFVPKATGINIGITFFEETTDPIVVLTYSLATGGTIHVGMDGVDLESVIPIIVGAVVRARTITEMITLYPDKRDEIIRNIMFRWTGVIEGDEEGG